LTNNKKQITVLEFQLAIKLSFSETLISFICSNVNFSTSSGRYLTKVLNDSMDSLKKHNNVEALEATVAWSLIKNKDSGGQ